MLKDVKLVHWLAGGSPLIWRRDSSQHILQLDFLFGYSTYFVYSRIAPIAKIISMGIVPLASVYPIAKRYTYYAQVVLGLCFNIGVFVGAAHVLGAGFTYTTALYLAPFYLGGITWTAVYDSIYAYTDRNDDIKQNLKGLAVKWGEDTKRNCILLNRVQGALFMTSGYLFGLNPVFYAGVSILTYLVERRINATNLDTNEGTQKYFGFNKHYATVLAIVIIAGRII